MLISGLNLRCSNAFCIGLRVAPHWWSSDACSRRCSPPPQRLVSSPHIPAPPPRARQWCGLSFISEDMNCQLHCHTVVVVLFYGNFFCIVLSTWWSIRGDAVFKINILFTVGFSLRPVWLFEDRPACWDLVFKSSFEEGDQRIDYVESDKSSKKWCSWQEISSHWLKPQTAALSRVQRCNPGSCNPDHFVPFWIIITFTQNKHEQITLSTEVTVWIRLHHKCEQNYINS